MPEPKQPQDRMPKAVKTEEPIKLSPEETPGWELMKDFNEIPVWEQTPLLSLLQSAIGDSEDEAENLKSFDVNIIGTMAQAMIPYAKDADAFTKFVSGSGAMERAMNLAMAWVGQMGEFGSSEPS
jgi:hypothetical protein